MKITKATFKKFIRDNKDALHINCKSSFSGMDDCVMQLEGGFRKAQPTQNHKEHTLEVDSGLWLVGSSRDYFRAYDDGQFTGIEVSNCCGSSVIAIPKQV
jgi:hypothetical protein